MQEKGILEVVENQQVFEEKTEDYSGLKLLLKDLAKKIIQQEYERIRKSSIDLHTSVFA